MEIKEKIESLLNSLKKIGVDRRAIEKDMDYKEFYIDQLLSKGGNIKFLKRLEKYNMEKNKRDGQNPTHFIEKNSEAGEEITKLRRKIVRLEASVNILLITVESIVADQKGTAIALVSGQLRQAIKMEDDRLYEEIAK